MVAFKLRLPRFGTICVISSLCYFTDFDHPPEYFQSDTYAMNPVPPLQVMHPSDCQRGNVVGGGAIMKLMDNAAGPPFDFWDKIFTFLEEGKNVQGSYVYLFIV